MTRATLEGLESSYDSPGLGEAMGWFEDPPTIGKRFMFVDVPLGSLLKSGTVMSLRELPGGVIGFRTKRTTYLLKPEAKRKLWKTVGDQRRRHP